MVSIGVELLKTIIFASDNIIMKKLLTLFIAFTLVSCNDGDFDVPDFEFEDEIYGCWDNQILYITSSADTETMVMTLIDDELGTEAGTETYAISSSREVVYRIFDEGIDSDYFCQAIPPTTPTVVNELNAQSGNITIVTSEVFDDDDDADLVTSYIYEITISNITFTDNDGADIFFESFDFGDEYEVTVD